MDSESPNDPTDGTDGADPADGGEPTAAYDFSTELGSSVRIVDADEAAAAVAAGEATGRRPADQPTRSARPESAPDVDAPRPSLRFPLDDSVDPAAVRENLAARETELPHWTEPPSGETPRLGGNAMNDETDDDLQAWSGLKPSPPAWRSEGDEWHPDDDVSLLADDTVRVGAMAEDHGFDEGSGSSSTAYGSSERVATGAGRDLPTAAAVGIGLFLALLILAAIGPGALMVIVTPIVVFAAFELFNGLQKVGYRPATLLGTVAVAGMVLGTFWRGESAISMVLVLAFLATMTWHLVGVEEENVTANAAVTMFGIIWVGVLGSFAALILTLDNGISILVSLVIVTVASDVGAYALGRQFGKTPLAPSVSPNKTIEGTVGGGVVAIAVSVIIVGTVPGLAPFEDSISHAFWLGLVVAIAGPLGDLAESLVKRDLGIKDMGQILPGHGGVFDRFDAMLFVLPSVYYLSRLLDLV